MHFHLPKPLHGWREFAGEVGIIVIGVLIALGAEQTVEAIRNHADLRESEDAMRSELRDDDLPQAYARAAVYNCYADQLDAIESAAAAGDRSKLAALAAAYRPITRTWDDQAWKAAQASPLLVQSGANRMLSWATPYSVIQPMSDLAAEERSALPALRAKLSGSGRLSGEQQDGLFRLIEQLRHYNVALAGNSLVLIATIQKLGIGLTHQQEEAILGQARQGYGACVRKPAPGSINFASQMSVNVQEQLGRK